MTVDANSFTAVIRRELERACKEFTAAVEPLGFARTKTRLWVRMHTQTADFIHFHRMGASYGAPPNASVNIRIHLGIRILKDSFAGLALNGPVSEPERVRAGRYHLRFNAETGSTYERCVHDLGRFIGEQGEPWFARFAKIERESSLVEAAVELLTGPPVKLCHAENATASSLKLLGVKAKSVRSGAGT